MCRSLSCADLDVGHFAEAENDAGVAGVPLVCRCAHQTSTGNRHGVQRNPQSFVLIAGSQIQLVLWKDNLGVFMGKIPQGTGSPDEGGGTRRYEGTQPFSTFRCVDS